jgi:hypothetical protein
MHIKNIAWKVSNLSHDLASVRYRAILPMLALNTAGIKSQVFHTASDLDLKKFDALFIVKSFTPEDLFLAQQAHHNGLKVIFDLCDNIFIPEYKGKQIVTPAEIFYAVMPYLSGVTVTTEALRKVVHAITNNQIPCTIIPDGIETGKEYKAAKKILELAAKKRIRSNISSILKSTKENGFLKAEGVVEVIKSRLHHLKTDFKTYLKPITWVNHLYIGYDLIRAKTTGAPRKSNKPIPLFAKDIYLNGKKISKRDIPPETKKIVWFGNHGAKYANFGILDLLPLRTVLEKAHQLVPIELIVISNNRDRFIKYIANFNCFTRYVEWSSTAVENVLATSSVSLVPNSLDPFSICKSANRTVLSLNANVPVIATLSPALQDLQSVIYYSNPYDDLIECLTQPTKAREKVMAGKKLIRELFGTAAICKATLNALENVKIPQINTTNSSKIVIALNLIQDFELAKPLVDRIKSAGLSYAVWISFSLARKSPKTLQWLTQDKINYLCLPDDIASTRPELFEEYGVENVLTMAETNLGPHKFTHSLTLLANNAGIKTFTFQHGYENIGLTYSDEIHSIKKIDIAATHILTWGNNNTFHPEIKNDIKAKTVPIGCIKPVWPEVQTETPLDTLSGPIIGIFENLHWHRYSNNYQQQFLDCLEKSAAKYPDVSFFIKPHPAGMWLTTRYKGDMPKQSNIIIAKPEDTKWETPLLGDYLRKLCAVISTPSTVVLDSARAGLPTLVCGLDLTLDKFMPLSIAKSELDWYEFIDQVVAQDTADLVRKNSDFVSLAILDCDAITKTLKLLST